MKRLSSPPPLPDHRCVTYLYLPFSREEVRPAAEYLAIAQGYLDEHFLWFAACANGTGREHYPEDFELLLQASVIYQRYFYWEEARRCLEALTESLRQPFPRTPEHELHYCRARLALAQLYDKLGDPDHCLRVLREILAGNPGFKPAREELALSAALFNLWCALSQKQKSELEPLFPEALLVRLPRLRSVA